MLLLGGVKLANRPLCMWLGSEAGCVLDASRLGSKAQRAGNGGFRISIFGTIVKPRESNRLQSSNYSHWNRPYCSKRRPTGIGRYANNPIPCINHGSVCAIGARVQVRQGNLEGQWRPPKRFQRSSLQQPWERILLLSSVAWQYSFASPHAAQRQGGAYTMPASRVSPARTRPKDTSVRSFVVCMGFRGKQATHLCPVKREKRGFICYPIHRKRSLLAYYGKPSRSVVVPPRSRSRARHLDRCCLHQPGKQRRKGTPGSIHGQDLCQR